MTTNHPGQIVPTPSLGELHKKLEAVWDRYIHEMRQEYAYTKYADEIETMDYYKNTALHGMLSMIDVAMCRCRVVDPWEGEFIYDVKRHAAGVRDYNGPPCDGEKA